MNPVNSVPSDQDRALTSFRTTLRPGVEALVTITVRRLVPSLLDDEDHYTRHAPDYHEVLQACDNIQSGDCQPP